METLVIGIDGGEWDIIDSMIRNEDLPNLAELKRTGVSGALQSTTPPISPPAWNSFQTGVNPGKHGIYDFTTFESDYQIRSVNATDRRATPFWNIMNDAGVSTGLFKLPFTYPPGQIDGFMVSGFPTPSSVEDFTEPSDLAEMAGPVEGLFEDTSLQKEGNYGLFKENIIDVAEHQTDVFLDIVSNYDADLSMTVYDGCDRIQHFFWKYFDESHPRHNPDSSFKSTIEEYYRTVDNSIGRILDSLDGDCDVLIISDHGFGPLTHDIYIDEWLEAEGFLSKTSKTSTTKWRNGLIASILLKSWKSLDQLGYKDKVKRIIPSSIFNYGRGLQDEEHRDIKWDQTEAFFTTLAGQGIIVNVKDKFSEGAVPANRYEKTVESIHDSIVSMQHPETGENLIENVFRRDELFDGWAEDTAPDLLVQTKPRYTLKGGTPNSLVQPSTQYSQDRSGDHRSEGILIASGGSFATGLTENAELIDIAPSLLALHDCPVPESMDGIILSDIFSDHICLDERIERTNQYGQTRRDDRSWTDAEASELADNLRDMGYLG